MVGPSTRSGRRLHQHYSSCRRGLSVESVPEVNSAASFDDPTMLGPLTCAENELMTKQRRCSLRVGHPHAVPRKGAPQRKAHYFVSVF